jgi:aryl sulfotransferase
MKYIAMTRYGKDILSSWYRFVNQHNPKFRDLWGGFPPPHSSFNVTFSYFHPKDHYHIADYCKEWWGDKDLDNVLFLHYSDLIRNSEATIRKIAGFINVTIPEEKWPTIVKTCSLQHMKTIQNRFLIHYNPKIGVDSCMVDDAMVGNGGTGQYKTMFTDEMHEIYENAMKELLPDEEMRTWCEFGDSGIPLE